MSIADVILTGGTVLTMDEGQDELGALPTAVAWSGDRVIAVGEDLAVLAHRGERTRVISMAGQTVCPGFIDAHHHFTLAAWCQLGVDLAGCLSAEEVSSRIAAATADLPTGEWAYAYNYNPRRFTHGAGVTRYDLDREVGNRPAVVMHFSYHEGVVSSAGLEAAGVGRHTPDPFGGRVVRDRHGEPTGELQETAVGPVEALARRAAASWRYDDWIAAASAYAQRLFAAGITHICDPGVDAMLESYLRRARREGALPMPVTMLFVHGKGLFQPPHDRLEGPVTGEELDGIAVGALKIFADGGGRCASCIRLGEAVGGTMSLALRAARTRRPKLLINLHTPDRPVFGRDKRIHTGFLHYTEEDMSALCARADARGFQLAIHAACNEGIANAIAAFEHLPAGKYRHRIEHLVSMDTDQARRLATTGAIGVVQPAYVTELGDEWDAMPTPTRLRSVALRTLLDAGVPLAGSSDAPVASFSPLQGMQAAVTRVTRNGYRHQLDQRITRLEALRLWTTGAARAANQEGMLGVLRPGARADLAILAGNPLAVPGDRLAGIPVKRTIVGGKTVYERR